MARDWALVGVASRRRPQLPAPSRQLAGRYLSRLTGHDPVALARAGRQDPVVADLVGTRRRDQGRQAIDELMSLHQDVGRAVPPARLEAQREPSVLEALVRERRPGDVAAEPFETSPVARGDADIGVEAHTAVLGYACRCLRVRLIRSPVRRLDPIAEASPRLAAMRPGGDAGPQRCGGQQCQQRLVARECIRVVSCARLDHALDPARGAGEHARHLVRLGRGQWKKSARLTLANRVGVDAVQRQRVEVNVQVERRAEALDEGDGAALLRANAPLPSRASAKLREQGTDEGAKHFARELRVVGAAVAECVGERENPLPHRRFRQHAIDQMRRRIRHATSTTRWTEAAALEARAAPERTNSRGSPPAVRGRPREGGSSPARGAGTRPRGPVPGPAWGGAP
jgi:hypothetical protein